MTTTINVVVGTSGDDNFANSLFGTNGHDLLQGLQGNDFLFGSPGDDTLDGGEGPDVALYDGLTFDDGVFVNTTGLAVTEIFGGAITSVGSGQALTSVGTDTLISIEQFNLSQADDIAYIGAVSGSYAFDGGGDDLVVFQGGPDVDVQAYAGAGNDTFIADFNVNNVLDYSADTVGQIQGIVVTQTAQDSGTVIDAWGDTDTFENFVIFRGTEFGDVIQGSATGQFISGNGGNDTIDGGAADPSGAFDFLSGDGGGDDLTGNDASFLVGGEGNDLFRSGIYFYETDPGGVKVNLSGVTQSFDGTTVAARTAIDGYGDVDTLLDPVVNGHGSSFDDVLWAGNGYFFARSGNDTVIDLGDGALIIPGSGADTIMGNDGATTAIDYFDDSFDDAGPTDNGITADLAAGTVIDNWGFVDVVSNIGSLAGSIRDDDIRGSDRDESFVGFSGADRIEAGLGNDTVEAGEGDDVIVDTGPGLPEAPAPEPQPEPEPRPWWMRRRKDDDDDEEDDEDDRDDDDDDDRDDDDLDEAGPSFGAFKSFLIALLAALSGAHNPDDGEEDPDASLDPILGVDDDIYTGGAGNDTFIFAESIGADVITDFEAGVGAGDVLDLTALGVTDLAGLVEKGVDSVEGAVFDFEAAGTLTLEGVQIADLVADDLVGLA